MRSNSQSCAGGAESGQVGDDLSNVDGSGSNSGVEGCSRGRGGEGSDGGDGELHFDGVGGCWWWWFGKRRVIILMGWLLKRV